MRVAFPFQLIGWRDELQTRGRKKKEPDPQLLPKASKQHVQESAMKINPTVWKNYNNTDF